MMPDGWRSRGGERAFSVSELEDYTDCPFKYLMRHCLLLESWQEPERQLELPKMTIGSIVHRVLERLLTDIAETGRISPDNLPWAQERLRQILDGEIVKARRRLPLIDIIWRLERDTLLLRLNSFIQEEYREPSEFRFHTAEEEFEQSINFKTAEGSLSLRLTGRIDRIDRTADGSALRLVDYKTGSIRTKSDSFSSGVGLQSPLYLKATLQKYPECDAAASRAEYVHILPDGEVKIVPFSGEALAEKEVDLGDLLVAVTNGISTGCFPPQPETRKCSSCDYKRACDRRSRISAQWRSDPRLTRLKEALAK
jgi:ATP-dependent helicase/DNAse subunit B